MKNQDGDEIRFYNRYTKNIEVEKVYGGGAVRFFYGNPLGQVLESFIALPFISQLYGFTQSTSLSAGKVPNFCENFSIDLSLYEGGSIPDTSQEKSYKSFNEFFIREFKPGKRPFVSGEDFPAIAEGRYLGYSQIDDSVSYPVKGHYLSANELIGKEEWGSVFEGGPLVIARLCPVDYHRYHYPADGKTLDSYTVGGALHSVNPLALKFRPSLFLENVRRVSILETHEFGKLAYIEVGATCVGRIVQSFDEKQSFSRGDEKGYFLFGGSTVILMGEKGRWSPSQDIVENTAKKREVYVHIGDKIAASN